jgi:hypothetical protein
MAILIDSFMNGDRGPLRFRRRRCGHLVSDSSLDELHEFAQALGVARRWFQLKSIPHYDLTGAEFDLALERGATLVSSREIVRRAVRLHPRTTSHSNLRTPLDAEGLLPAPDEPKDV